MTRDWVRLGAALAEARRSAGLTQEELADRTGVSRATIQGVERGQTYAKVQPTHRAVAAIVGWTEDSIDRVLHGGDPAQADSRPQQGVLADEASSGVAPLQAKIGLPLRIVQELEEGPLLDAQVVDLTQLGSSARMIVVVKGAPDASKDEIRRDLLAWARAQEALEGLEGHEGADDSPSANHS